MDSKEEACAECTRSCLCLHRTKRDPYPIVSSFFKVMFGKQFGDELIVPPRFAKTIQSLEGKNTCLEDSTGQKWDVRLSKVNGSLIFQSGWHEFSKDHGIELGDFVVFHYIRGSHFIVQTFTRTGCERPALFCDKNYQNKRRKSTRNSFAKGDSDDTPNTEILPKVCSDSRKVSRPEVDSVQRQDNVRKSVDVSEDCLNEGSIHKKPKVAPAEDFVADPFMAGRTTSVFIEDDRGHLFDLSAFETPAKKGQIDDTNVTKVNRCPQGSNQSQNAQIGTASVEVEKSQIAETSPLLVSNEARVPKEEPNSLSKSSSNGGTARTITKQQRPCENDGGYWVAQKFRYIPTDHENFINLEVPADNNSHDLDSLKDKVATDDCFLSKTSVMIKSTCSAEESGEPFLELPECLPIKICRQGAEIHKKLIRLLDPTGKDWPVLYQEKKGVNILTHGWKAFMKYNNIQSGDQCTFVLEDTEKCIFKVDILRK